MSRKWTASDVPDQSGRVAIVTGANSGLGYDTAAILADKGAHVVLAVRNLDKGKEAVDRITAASPNAVVMLQELDLSSLDSVRKAADELRAAHPRIDLLINNAGVMYVPTRETTKDGFEMQFGTNHLGHFALTGLLLDHLTVGRRIAGRHGQQRRAPHPGPHPFRRPHVVAQVQPRRGVRPVQARQPDVHLRPAAAVEGSRARPTVALAAHPGFADTELMRYLPDFIPAFMWKIATQPADKGALPSLRAATDPDARGGQYYGPDGIGEVKGSPKVVASSEQSRNEDLQRRLWTLSEELTGVTYPV